MSTLLNLITGSFSSSSLFNFQGPFGFLNPLELSARLFYHIVFGLSRTFFKFFKTFLISFFSPRNLRFFVTACLLYRVDFSLSRTFFIFLKVFSNLKIFICSSRQLAYNITSSLLCQYLFQTFFKRFE